MVHNTLREGDGGRYHDILREDELDILGEGMLENSIISFLIYHFSKCYDIYLGVLRWDCSTS